jgi:hypothetical protein
MLTRRLFRRLSAATCLIVAAWLPGPSSAAVTVSANTVIGRWTGQWTARPGPAHGAIELILARVPGSDSVLGHFTFVKGAVSRTLRYEGRIENGTLHFPLVGDGHVILHPRDADRPGPASTLHGDWLDARGGLPAPQGALELNRVR